MIKLPYYFVKTTFDIFTRQIFQYFKFSPQCFGSISGPPPPPLFGVETIQVSPSPQITHSPPPQPPLIIYERSLKSSRRHILLFWQKYIHTKSNSTTTKILLDNTKYEFVQGPMFPKFFARIRTPDPVGRLFMVFPAYKLFEVDWLCYFWW